MAKGPNIFEKRRRQIDKMSGWEDPPPKKKKEEKKKTKKKKGS